MTQNEGSGKHKEIIDKCLEEFVENGLYKTSARDLARALHMQTSALYYYFKNKDDIVIACAEEAGIRMEDALILPFLECLNEPEEYQSIVQKRMDETTAVMKFFAQVCTTKEYREAIQPVFDRLKKDIRSNEVKTGDSTPISAWLAMLLLSFIGMIGIGIKRQ